MFYALGGWGFVFWGTCARVTACVVGHWLIGYFAHNHGPMHFEVQAAAVQGRNIRFTSLLTMGESWHNNHHAFPTSARHGRRWWEVDLSWLLILALARCGWVWDINRGKSQFVQDFPSAGGPSLGVARDQGGDQVHQAGSDIRAQLG